LTAVAEEVGGKKKERERERRVRRQDHETARGEVVHRYIPTRPAKRREGRKLGKKGRKFQSVHRLSMSTYGRQEKKEMKKGKGKGVRPTVLFADPRRRRRGQRERKRERKLKKDLSFNFTGPPEGGG